MGEKAGPVENYKIYNVAVRPDESLDHVMATFRRCERAGGFRFDPDSLESREQMIGGKRHILYSMRRV